MMKLFIFLLVILNVSVSDAQLSGEVSDKFKVITTAEYNGTFYPYNSIAMSTITDLGSFVIRAMKKDEYVWGSYKLSILPDNTVFETQLTPTVGAHGAGCSIPIVGGVSVGECHVYGIENTIMSQNEKHYYYVFHDYLRVENGWLNIMRMSINNGALSSDILYSINVETQAVDIMAVNNNGSLVAIIFHIDDQSRTIASAELVRFDSMGNKMVLDQNYSSPYYLNMFNNVTINDLDTVFTTVFNPAEGADVLYSYDRFGIKKLVSRGVKNPSSELSTVQPTNQTTTQFPEGLAYYVKDNQVLISGDEVVFTPPSDWQMLSIFVTENENVYTWSWSGSGVFITRNNEIIISKGQTLLGDQISWMQYLKGNSLGQVVFVVGTGNATTNRHLEHIVLYNDDSTAPEYKLAVSVFKHFEQPIGQDLNFCTETAKLANDTSVCQAGKIKEGSVLTIPFGGHLQFALTDKDDKPIPATFELVAGTYEWPVHPLDPTKKLAVESGSLYPNQVAIMFTPENEKKTQNFITVHMGEQKLKITPLDSTDLSIKLKPLTVTLKSVAPHVPNDPNRWRIPGYTQKIAELNTNEDNCVSEDPNCVKKMRYYLFDGPIIFYAHKYGIPPQYIKAKLIQESKLLPNAYRYEPKYDSKHVTNKYIKNRTPEEIQKKLAAYKGNIFYTDSKPIDSQIHPRSKYFIFLNGATTPTRIPDTYEKDAKPTTGKDYTPLMAKDIVTYYNNEVNPHENWYNYNDDYDKKYVVSEQVLENGAPKTITYFDYNKIGADLDFLAQTVIASSYGISQTMLMTAFEMGYKDELGHVKDPLKLFDPVVSIQLGTSYLANRYVKINGLKDVNSAPLTRSEYNKYIRQALRAYNGSIKNPATKSYADQIIGWDKTATYTNDEPKPTGQLWNYQMRIDFKTNVFN